MVIGDRSAKPGRPAFSPLIIGVGSSAAGFIIGSPGFRNFQSPHHRGWVCGRKSRLIRAFSFFQVSVPSSSGLGLRHTKLRFESCNSGQVSVPSSSGLGLRPRGIEIVRGRRAAFQSPHHRGWVCGRVGTLCGWGQDRLVSVPSSSGLGLRHGSVSFVA